MDSITFVQQDAQGRELHQINFVAKPSFAEPLGLLWPLPRVGERVIATDGVRGVSGVVEAVEHYVVNSNRGPAVKILVGTPKPKPDRKSVV